MEASLGSIKQVKENMSTLGHWRGEIGPSIIGTPVDINGYQTIDNCYQVESNGYQVTWSAGTQAFGSAEAPSQYRRRFCFCR